jgi:hypothetical protein
VHAEHDVAPGDGARARLNDPVGEASRGALLSQGGDRSGVDDTDEQRRRRPAGCGLGIRSGSSGCGGSGNGLPSTAGRAMAMAVATSLVLLRHGTSVPLTSRNDRVKRCEIR